MRTVCVCTRVCGEAGLEPPCLVPNPCSVTLGSDLAPVPQFADLSGGENGGSPGRCCADRCVNAGKVWVQRPARSKLREAPAVVIVVICTSAVIAAAFRRSLHPHAGQRGGVCRRDVPGFPALVPQQGAWVVSNPHSSAHSGVNILV